MKNQPAYVTPGSRSVAEGSGVTGSIPKMAPGAGELTPPGLVSYPGGNAEVSYRDGATMTAKGGPIKGSSMTAPAPLTYKNG